LVPPPGRRAAQSRPGEYLLVVAIIPLYGHEALRRSLGSAAAGDSLGQSLLLHGPRGVGKQRLALWLAQLLLCERPGAEPCGECRSCGYATGLTHPDLHWYFPRPRPKGGDQTPQEVREEFAELVADRARGHGLYGAADGMSGIFIASVRAIVLGASVTPAMGKRKVVIVGEAHRMVPQEGMEEAANAFLKLLEEPPPDTTILLTSSEPGALLPTIRSRVVAVRVPLLGEKEVSAFLDDDRVQAALKGGGLPASREDRLELAAGAPGRLLGDSGWREAMEQARALLAGADGGMGERLRVAIGLKPAGARGAFSESLDALAVLVHQRMKRAVREGRTAEAARASRAMDAIERARDMASGNVNPQLLGASLLRELSSGGR
jgi:DNA polymerase III subunit delta'